MRAVIAAAALAITGASVPANAVGLGPLAQDGIIDGPNRGFSLTLLNPYEQPVAFHAYAVGSDDEDPQLRVAIYPADVTLGAGQTRRLLVIASNLQLGETYKFRVCAERARNATGVNINARVCSKMSVRRLG